MVINMFESARRVATLLVAFVISAMFLAGCDQRDAKDDDVFTLYWNGPLDPSDRNGVATFDIEGIGLNQSLCQEAADMYQAEWERTKGKSHVRHWCEKGRFKK